jgi:DNA-binding CsgD family transcriptional regulator
LGAPLWSRRARDELARVGGRSASSPELTPTELQVAEAAAVGLTNRQVADRLFLSVHTVSDNLKRAYRKLGIGNRTELARALSARRDRPGEPGAMDRSD